MEAQVKIGKHEIGTGHPCLIVGEVAQAHEGSLSLAHAYIEAIADAGADAVKFQCHIAEAESMPDEPWRVEPEYPQDANRYAYWKRMEFTFDQWAGLAAHAWRRGLAFIVSPFSVEAVEMMTPLVDAWKVASGEIANEELLHTIGRTRRSVLISTGMATKDEILFAATNVFADREHNKAWRTHSPVFCDRAILHCISEYPAPAEHCGLNVLAELRAQYPYPVGLSDHSGTIYAGLAAVALGCDVLEVHVTFSRAMGGFDTSSSITLEDLGRLVEGVRWIERAKAHPVDKDAMAKELEPMRALFIEKHKRKAMA